MAFWERYMSDEMMGTIAPIIVYWIYAGIYQLLPSMERYRLHTRKELEHQKNLVPFSTVIKGVLLQQVAQAIVAQVLLRIDIPEFDGQKHTKEFMDWLDDVERVFKYEEFYENEKVTSKGDVALKVQPSIPVQITQIIIAMFVMDTWQYFVHRYMHYNKFLYRHIHSQHHRLVVPYAIGALYNHPLEGLLLDTLGGAISFLISGMTAQTAVIFFCFAVIKTVDDHCGLCLPGNIFHLIFRNNTAYHDIHHQLQGLKYNYSQPFFSLWDKILGTYMPYSLVRRPEGGYEARADKKD